MRSAIIEVGNYRHEVTLIMPIPELNEHGLLPEGIYPCGIEDIRNRFGQFCLGSPRFDLMTRLENFVADVRHTNMVKWLGIDGSFVTNKTNPGDVDILMVLPNDHDFSSDLRPFEYNVISRKRVQRRYAFDVLPASENSETYQEYLSLFTKVKDRPALRKGFLRIDL